MMSAGNLLKGEIIEINVDFFQFDIIANRRQ